MHIIDHPESFKQGTRIVMLKGRYKDGLEKQRSFMRISHKPEHFDYAVSELQELSQEGERIYVTASPRDVAKASRLFKHRQLDASYDADPEDFYRRLQDRWISCLMNDASQVKGEKLWMYDCDNAEELTVALEHIGKRYDRPRDPYKYNSKSGVHILVSPFNVIDKLPDPRILNKNPLMLWGY